jgi:hypothetical protein
MAESRFAGQITAPIPKAKENCIKLLRGGNSLSPERWASDYGDKLSPPLFREVFNPELDAALELVDCPAILLA